MLSPLVLLKLLSKTRNFKTESPNHTHISNTPLHNTPLFKSGTFWKVLHDLPPYLHSSRPLFRAVCTWALVAISTCRALHIPLPIEAFMLYLSFKRTWKMPDTVLVVATEKRKHVAMKMYVCKSIQLQMFLEQEYYTLSWLKCMSSNCCENWCERMSHLDLEGCRDQEHRWLHRSTGGMKQTSAWTCCPTLSITMRGRCVRERDGLKDGLLQIERDRTEMNPSSTNDQTPIQETGSGG